MTGATADAVVAVDIGGTKTAAALVDRDARILETLSAPTPGADGPEAILGTVIGLARELAARPDVRVHALGVGTAGVVDVARGAIVSATDTLARWAGTPVAAVLRDSLADVIPNGLVHVQNDVDAHAVGEFRHGAARGARSALVVAVGTGVGGGILLEGGPLRGARHVAGEIAHMPIPGAEHLRCPCGRMGHLEALGSGIGIHRHYLSLGGDPQVADTRALAVLAASGDDLARRAIADGAAAVGRAIAGAVTLLDPERVVVTGGVAQIGETWWAPMERAFRAEVIDVLQNTVLLPGELGADAPLLGAAASAWDLTGEDR